MPIRPLSQDAAESLAISALSYLGGDETRLFRFLSLTGMSVADLRASAGSPEFLAAILDHLASDERLLLDFCNESNIAPATVAAARETLSGQRPWLST